MKRVTFLILALVLGLSFYLFNSFKKDMTQVNFANPGELIKAVQEKSSQIKNYRYDTVISIGDQIKVAVANRVIRQDGERMMVNFSWEIPKMSGTAAMYSNQNKIYLFHILKNKWLLPSEEPTLKPFLDFFWKQLKMIDPVKNFTKINPNGQNVTINTGSQGDLPEDTVILQVIPAPDVLAEIRKTVPPQFSGAQLYEVRQVFWISKKDLTITRFEVYAKANLLNIKTMEFKVISKAKDYNDTEINIPKLLQDKMNTT
jgi:hypothetical protein